MRHWKHVYWFKIHAPKSFNKPRLLNSLFFSFGKFNKAFWALGYSRAMYQIHSLAIFNWRLGEFPTGFILWRLEGQFHSIKFWISTELLGWNRKKTILLIFNTHSMFWYYGFFSCTFILIIFFLNFYLLYIFWSEIVFRFFLLITYIREKLIK